MGERKLITPDMLPVLLTPKAFRMYIVDWSDDKLRRKVQNEGLPAHQEASGRYVYPTAEVLLWFKRQGVKIQSA